MNADGKNDAYENMSEEEFKGCMICAHCGVDVRKTSGNRPAMLESGEIVCAPLPNQFGRCSPFPHCFALVTQKDEELGSRNFRELRSQVARERRLREMAEDRQLERGGEIDKLRREIDSCEKRVKRLSEAHSKLHDTELELREELVRSGKGVETECEKRVKRLSEMGHFFHQEYFNALTKFKKIRKFADEVEPIVNGGYLRKSLLRILDGESADSL